jgi:NAD(P)-dependent dehydrogenase (short-subunit alcohol dehydrogenase family)
VNVIGVHRMVVAALPLLRASRGTIVNAGPGAATTPMEGWTAYCTSKAGVHMLTRLLALELGPDGIQSFFIGIPPTDTAMQAEIRAAGHIDHRLNNNGTVQALHQAICVIAGIPMAHLPTPYSALEVDVLRGHITKEYAAELTELRRRCGVPAGNPLLALAA